MDSDNILSILASLGAGQQPQAAPSNFLQQAAPPLPAYSPPPAAPVAPTVAPTTEAPRPRRSLLDTLGRISDVIAKVGGADALYQPTLDAREDRTLALGDHSRKVDADNIALATGKFDLSDKHNIRLGQVARGLKAIQTAGGDINQAWPLLAQRMQLDPETVQSIGQALATDPHALEGLIGATTDPKYDQSKYGGTVVYAKDAKTGNLVAYQPSLSGDEARNILPEGVVPIDPLKFVDTGNAQVGVGTRSGTPVRILPKSVAPDTRANIGSRERIAAAGNRSRETIAAMPARSGAGKTANPAMVATGAAPVVAALRDAITRLHDSGGMTDQKSGIGDTASAVARENVPGYERFTNKKGFSARQDLNRLLTVGIPSLLPLMGGLQLGGKNIDAAKELETWRNAIASAKDYPSAIRAIEGFERRIAELSRSAPAARPKAKSDWTIVEVK